MKQYYINGQEIEEGQNKTCLSCKNGEVFSKDVKKTQKHEGGVKEYICSICNTKYFVLKKEKPKLIDLNCKKCSYLSNDEEECKNLDEFFLCIGNKDRFLEKIFELEENKMTIDFISKRKVFETLGICKHDWIKSKPFKTAEGHFEIVNCRVCQLAKINYKGQMYEDKLMNIVTFLAHQGIKNEKSIADKIEMLGFMDFPKEEIKIDKLFSTDLELMPKEVLMPKLNFI